LSTKKALVAELKKTLQPHDVVNEKFTSVNKREEFYFK
jgi:hypothetical protein